MYYLGFLKQNTKDVVVFKSVKAPKKNDFLYFVRVVGPYTTEEKARKGLQDIKIAHGEHGYRENPSAESRKEYRASNPVVSERQRKFMCSDLGRLRSGKKTVTGMRESQLRDFCVKRNPAKYMTDRQALSLTKKVIALGKRLFKHEQSEIRRGNPASGHMSKFLSHIKMLEKYAVGSKAYIDKLAEAYGHLQAAKKVMMK